jgi:Protein of unknown function (DUF2950)
MIATTTTKRRAVSLVTGLIAVLAWVVTAVAAEEAPAQTYPTAEAAAEALVTATRSDDPQALLGVLGGAAEALSSGDPIADATARRRFAAQYDEAHALVADGTERYTLEVGDDAWPMPIPIVKTAAGWSFDVEAGIDELVYRRIGSNELGAIETCRGIVEAQRRYASEGRDGQPAGVYARKLVSDPGQHNGLYWPAQPDQPASPVGPFVAEAAAEGYLKDGATAGPEPYHGYIYRLLTAQGPAAPGGAKSYLVDGRLSGGYAVIAYPAEYRSSGVETFITNQDGVVYQQDLGPDTAAIAAAIETFDPDASWTEVVD